MEGTVYGRQKGSEIKKGKLLLRSFPLCHTFINKTSPNRAVLISLCFEPALGRWVSCSGLCTSSHRGLHAVRKHQTPLFTACRSKRKGTTTNTSGLVLYCYLYLITDKTDFQSMDSWENAAFHDNSFQLILLLFSLCGLQETNSVLRAEPRLLYPAPSLASRLRLPFSGMQSCREGLNGQRGA